MNFNNFRQRIANVIYPKVNAASIDPIGAAYPYATEIYDSRIDAEKLLHVSEMGQADRILWQIIMMVLNDRDLKIITPEDQNPESLAEKSNEVKMKLWRVDRALEADINMAKLWIDQVTFGSGLLELGLPINAKGEAGWGRLDDWNAPVWAQYLDAYSFSDLPSHANNTKEYIPGRVLPGIVYDKANKQMTYWQTQAEGEQPVQLPTGRILHLKDKRSRYPDGKSYLAGIAPTVAQLEFVRKSFMQRVNYAGVGRFIIKVKEMRDDSGQPLKPPDGSTDKPRWAKAYKAGENFLKSYGNNNIGLLWDDHEIMNVAMPNVADMTKPDEYLKLEILNHLIPRDFVEQSAQAISASGTPLLELILMVVHGWRVILSEPFEELYTKILEANGYEDWSVKFTYKDPNFADKQVEKQLAVQLYVNGGISEDRLYEIMGWKPLSKEERKALEDKRAAQGVMY